jgi:hypothetical protein
MSPVSSTPCFDPGQTPCFSILPLPAYLQLSDRHDLLPSQFHLAQLYSGQLCHPVPALLGRTRGHPTGPGLRPGSPKAQRAPATCVKGGKVLELLLLLSASLSCHRGGAPPPSSEGKKDLCPLLVLGPPINPLNWKVFFCGMVSTSCSQAMVSFFGNLVGHYPFFRLFACFLLSKTVFLHRDRVRSSEVFCLFVWVS